MFLNPNESNMADYISELPDHLLSYILKRISMKDLLKTSILSKRWCELWTLRKNLYFDIFNVFEETEEELLQTGYIIDAPRGRMRDEETEKQLLQAGYLIDDPDSPTMKRLANVNTSRDEFVKRVDKFVKNFHGTKIDSFLVNFYLNCDQSAIIDGWITFAIAREVERIDLLFLGLPYAQNNRRKFYKFPLNLLLETKASTLKNLSLECCFIHHSTNYDFSPLKNLRFLSLELVKLDEIFVESLLSNCGLLEELHLFSCSFEASMPKIVSSSLLNLKIIDSYISPNNLYKVQVYLTLLDCPKLTSLQYLGYGLNTMSINTPMMKCIDFSISHEEDFNIFDLSATFLELETMRISITSTVIASLNITQPLKNLKQLNLTLLLNFDIPTVKDVNYDLLWILNILQASPLLQKLSVMFTYPEFLKKQKDIRDIETFSHDEIKVIEFRGFLGNWFEIEFVINALKYVEKLEQIVLTPCWKEDDDDSLDWISDPVCFQSARERIREKLLQGEEIMGREKLVLK